MQRLVGLQVLRALAAMMVLIHHAWLFAAQAAGMEVSAGFLRLQLGGIGVMLFFVLSGLVMAISTSGDPPRKFALSRILRIYPPYFIALGLSAAMLTVVGAAPTWTWDPSPRPVAGR